MFYGDWLQRREMLSPSKIALIDAIPSTMLKPGASLTQADLSDWLREQIAHYKVPKSVVFVDTLPKTAANKVDKQQLIEQYGS